MKISNGKKELARIISENGGWRDGEFSVMRNDGMVLNSSNKPFYEVKYGWCCGGGFGDSRFESAIVAKNWHQTVLSREEYFHLYPTPDADGWIEWKGGECPVERCTLVDVKYANGITNIGVSALTDKTHADHTFGTAGSMLATNWSSGLPMSGIIAYRLHKPERENPESREPVMSALIGVDMASGSDSTAIFTVNAKPTIEQLAADYRNAKDYYERKQKEADDAKADADEALRRLGLAGEEIGLIVTPIAAKQEPELVITDWRDLQAGDIIELTAGERYIKTECTMVYVPSVGLRAKSAGDTENQWWYMGGIQKSEWRFIRRP